jgi:hypothetical protein
MMVVLLRMILLADGSLVVSSRSIHAEGDSFSSISSGTDVLRNRSSSSSSVGIDLVEKTPTNRPITRRNKKNVHIKIVMQILQVESSADSANSLDVKG